MFFLFVVFMLSFALRNCAIEIPAVTKTAEKDSIKTKVTPLCDAAPGTLVITGDIVKLSEFLKWDGTFDKHCGNNSNVTVAYIFALRKLIFDQNFYAPGFDLFVLAPTWEVITISKIYLVGPEGEPMQTPEPGDTGADGVDGKPGNPGNPGGNFFGVGETFIDGKYLTIDVSGGEGGTGQQGGVGGPGAEGRHADKGNLSLTCSHFVCNAAGTELIPALDNEGNYSYFRCKEVYNYMIYDMFFISPPSRNVRKCSYYIYGAEGPVAGTGGDGGVGGKGGHPGTITLVELFEPSGISKVNNSGNTGMAGRGNQGGEWAYRGRDVSFKKIETYSDTSPHVSDAATIEYVDSYTFVRPDRSLGVDGVNSRHIKEPVYGEPVDFPKLYKVIKEYFKFISV